MQIICATEGIDQKMLTIRRIRRTRRSPQPNLDDDATMSFMTLCSHGHPPPLFSFSVVFLLLLLLLLFLGIGPKDMTSHCDRCPSMSHGMDVILASCSSWCLLVERPVRVSIRSRGRMRVER